MSAKVNLALQLCAIAAAGIMRFSQFGWLVVLFVSFVVGPVLVLAHVVAAVLAAGRERLAPVVAVPFVGAAVSLLLANVLIADLSDSPQRVASPLEQVTGYLPTQLQDVGWILMLGWAACVVWTLVALVATRRSAAIAT